MGLARQKEFQEEIKRNSFLTISTNKPTLPSAMISKDQYWNLHWKGGRKPASPKDSGSIGYYLIALLNDRAAPTKRGIKFVSRCRNIIIKQSSVLFKQEILAVLEVYEFFWIFLGRTKGKYLHETGKQNSIF